MELVVAGPADEALLLDLLNTTPVIDGVAHDELAESRAARKWLRDRGVAPTDAQLAALREVRPVLQGVVRGEAKPAALHGFLDGVRLEPTVSGSGLDWRLAVDDAAARVVLAWDALRISSPGRLRPCANTECRLFLLDRSKPNTARWCSMAVCGNRMKARRHYRRTRT
ncbi:Conserved protein containing a Zn-ribbon-like motif, possibly RNA-binding [Mycolicibacterium rutilum]|uniref:Conserved protein containing a Zn-ribbon-like motif, possibly RNA-binding n=1 Tax=Mycolicibacterium rutilum TaxID=370526 RepID=A0A1H6L9W5_MYCRU|nr:CGNR zinc finger domain-containing protein [Mycolicibacterium rutilum]SEH81324.1 Conserved protein containing a Zn-ribbon-like motif, possibly RNA-binding [Mycolicibacterium rutilum]